MPARINQELDISRISNVKIVQPACLTLKAAKPKRLILAILGTMMSFLASIATAIGLDVVDSSVRSSDELRKDLGIPVLVSLPRTPARKVIAH